MKLQMPQKCPYCGKDFAFENDRHLIDASFIDAPAKSWFFAVDALTCWHCKHVSIAIRDPKDNLLSFFPSNLNTDLPNEISKLSPRTCAVYLQVQAAQNFGLDNLRGAGLRIALEILVTDYLVKFKGMPELEVAKLSLSRRLYALKDWNSLASTCADIVRRFGNDEIHFFKDYCIDFLSAQEAFLSLCQVLAVDIRHTHDDENDGEPS